MLSAQKCVHSRGHKQGATQGTHEGTHAGDVGGVNDVTRAESGCKEGADAGAMVVDGGPWKTPPFGAFSLDPREDSPCGGGEDLSMWRWQ